MIIWVILVSARIKNDLKWKKFDEMCDVPTENTDSLRQLEMCVIA